MTCIGTPQKSKFAKLATALLTMLLLAFAANTANTANALTPSERKVVLSMKSALTQLRGKLAEADTANKSYMLAVTKASQQVAILQESARAAEAQSVLLTAERDQLATDYAVQTEHLKKVNKRYQTAQFIIAITVAGCVGLLVFQLAAAIPLQYRIIAAAGAGSLAAAIVYMVL